jgi:hypothetical protein
LAFDNFIKKSHNKLNSTWKSISTESGRISKQNNSQDLIKKFKNQNAAEHINDYLISIGNKLMKTDVKHSNSTATEFLPFMHQAISNSHPRIRNDPPTPKEIEKNN